MQEDAPPRLLTRAAAFVRSYWTPAGKQAMGNLAGLLVCQAIGLSCQLVNLVALTNSIAPADYGKYTLAISIFPYLYVLGTLAGGTITLRELRREGDRFGVIVSSHLQLAMLLALAGTTITIAAAWLAPLQGERFAITAIALASAVASVSLSFAFDAEHRPALGAAATAAADIVLTSATLIFAALGVLTLTLAACLVPVRWFVLVALQWIVQFGVFRRTLSRPSAATRRLLLIGSTSPMLIALLWNANAALAVFFVRSLFGDRETAYYGVAVLISTVASSTVDLAFRIVGPHILGPHGLEGRFLVKLASFLAGFLAAISLGAFAAAWLLSGAFLPAEYAAMLGPLAWLLAAGVGRGVWEAAAWYLVRFDRQPITLVNMSCACLTSNLFGYLTARHLGIASFAVGTCLAFAVAAGVNVVCVRFVWKAQK